MKDIKLYHDPRYDNTEIYQQVEDGVYEVVNKTDDMVDIGEAVMSLEFKLEGELDEVDERQYPLEDILDKYLLYVSHFIQDEPGEDVLVVEVAGGLDDVKRSKEIIGKRVALEEEMIDGAPYVRLVIEDELRE